jgi:hypothetical protein
MKTKLKQLDQSGATDGQVAKWNNSNSKWEPANESGGGSHSKCEVIPLVSTDAQAYLTASADSYQVKVSTPWRGSTDCGTPSNIKAVADTNGGEITSWHVKIYDVTNSQTICEGSGSNSTKAIGDLGTLSNVSSGEAVWEIQAKRTGSGNNKGRLHSLVIYY